MVLLGGLIVGLLAAPAGAEATAPPTCDPHTPPALDFAGLPSRVVTGPKETFGFGRTFESEWNPADPFIARMENPRGRAFFEGSLDNWRDRCGPSGWCCSRRAATPTTADCASGRAR
jgi:hypothetical protein